VGYTRASCAVDTIKFQALPILVCLPTLCLDDALLPEVDGDETFRKLLSQMLLAGQTIPSLFRSYVFMYWLFNNRRHEARAKASDGYGSYLQGFRVLAYILALRYHQVRREAMRTKPIFPLW